MTLPGGVALTCPLSLDGLHQAERSANGAGWCPVCREGWEPGQLGDLIGRQLRALAQGEDGDDQGEPQEAAGDASAFRREYDAAAAEAVAPSAAPIIAKLTALPEGAEARLAVPILEGLRDAVKSAKPVERAAVRADAVKALSKLRGAAALVDAALGPTPGATAASSGQGRAVAFADPEPWQEAVAGAVLLDSLVVLLKRFAALPPGAAVAIALWSVGAHALDAFTVAAILALLSAAKRSGKTTVLLLLARLVPRPLLTSSLTAAVLFRAVERFSPTLLADEADTWLTDDRHELRGIYNSGHTRDTAVAMRCDGDAHEPKLFSTWCPKALAAIGRLPDTIADRSIVVNMRRAAPDEKVERLRLDRIGAELEPLRRQAARWASDHLEELRASDPDVPAELNDRQADGWRCLLAIADLAGGEWPERAREAARTLSTGEVVEDTSAAVMLLSDLRELFEERGSDRLPSATIVEVLGKMEDRPWPEWRNDRPLTTRQLARLLAPFGVKPKTLRTGDDRAKGYELAAFEDAFRRYLPPPIRDNRDNSTGTGTLDRSAIRDTPPPVTDRKSRNLKRDGLCHGVTDRKGGPGTEGASGPPPETAVVATAAARRKLGLDAGEPADGEREALR